MIKSPLRYPGGKSRAVEKIAKVIPDFNEFREPFLGGGSVFIYLKQIFPKKKYWVNDLYSELYLFWKSAQKDVNLLTKKVYELRNSYKTVKICINILMKTWINLTT